MGAIHVHEFMSLDGVIDAPTWTFDYGFDPRMGEAIGAVTERAEASCSGARPTRCSSRRGRRGPSRRSRARRSSTTPPSTSSPRRSRPRRGGTRDHRAVRPRRDPQAEGRGRRRPLRQRQRHAGPAMLADGLVDELHLFVYPLTRGSGPRLFPEGAAPASCRSRTPGRTRTASSTSLPTGRRRAVGEVEVGGLAETVWLGQGIGRPFHWRHSAVRTLAESDARKRGKG